MLPTPSTSHVNYDHIYEPAEDSYLLLDTLSSATEAAFLEERFPASAPSPVVLEVGVGSGVVLAFAAAQAGHIFGRSDVLFLGTDANGYACKAASQTVHLAIVEQIKTGNAGGIFGDCINGDLGTALKPGEVDVLIFNPPYVPTEALPHVSDLGTPNELHDFKEDFVRDSHLLALSYAGGVDGMEITNRLLDALPETLNRRGVAYVLLCKQNRPDEVTSRIREWAGGWSAEVVGSSGKTAGWERLCIVRIWRP